VRNTATHTRTALEQTAALCSTLCYTAPHCNTLPHTAPHCTAPQRSATHRNTLCRAPQHTATHYNTATYCNTLQHICNKSQHAVPRAATHCDISQQARPTRARRGAKLLLTHCNTLQHTATHCNTLRYTTPQCDTLQHTATRCNTSATHHNNTPGLCEARGVQITARERLLLFSSHKLITHGNTLQHTATHRNTPHHTAPHRNTPQRI